MMKNSESTWMMLLGIIVCVLILSIFVERDKLFTIRVKKNSKRLKEMREIAKTVAFKKDLESEYFFGLELNTKVQYDRFDFDKYMKRQIEQELGRVEWIIDAVEWNRAQYEFYRWQVSQLPELITEEKSRAIKVPYHICRREEMMLCKGEELTAMRIPKFRCEIRYTSLHGRNRYRDEKVFNYEEIKYLYQQVQKEIRYRSSAAYQRQKMTDSLRYDILKRDGFRCVICGRTAEDGVKLHVDHILPVSKGGMTEPENLRTLCDMCNLGKRDKYDAYGYN